MEIPINKDIDKFKKDFFKGLSFRETVWCTIAFVMAACMIGFLYFKCKVNITIAVYIAMPGAFLVAVNGFYNKNGMTLWQKTLKKRKVSKSKAYVLKCNDQRTYIIERMNNERREMKNVKDNTKAVQKNDSSFI